MFFPQENNHEIIRKRTKRSWEQNHRTIARDTRGPDEITQEDLDNVADFSTRKVYNQVTVCILVVLFSDYKLLLTDLKLQLRGVATDYTLPYLVRFLNLFISLLGINPCIKIIKSH